MSDGFYDDEDDKEEEDDRPSFKRARRGDADTSKRAADNKKFSQVRMLIYETLKAAGEPLTAEEINERAGIDGQTGNPRYNELMEDGLICLTGKPRKNRSGKDANLWRITTRKEGIFLRKRAAGGFAGADAFLRSMEDTPEIDEAWPLLSPDQKNAYAGGIRKLEWDYFKKKGIKAYMQAYGEYDEDDSP